MFRHSPCNKDHTGALNIKIDGSSVKKLKFFGVAESEFLTSYQNFSLQLPFPPIFGKLPPKKDFKKSTFLLF